jgi:hypothetical protein
MGIHGFNTIIRKFGKKYNIDPDVIIIDGSNLICIFLESALSELRKQFPTIWGEGINLHIKTQFRELCKMVTTSIVWKIKSVRSGARRVYLVFDPPYTPKYTLTPNLEIFTYEQLKYIFSEEELDNEMSKVVNSKQEEQINRQKYKKDDRVMIKEYVSNIENEEYVKIVTSIINQTMYFNGNSHKKKLWNFIKHELRNTFDENKDFEVFIVDAQDEADIVIKNIASEYSQDETILVMSSDTDYYVLFYECDNVYIKDLLRHVDGIYSPRQVIQSYLGFDAPTSLVHRMAPIFGNDYTAHEKIIDCNNNYENFKLLINGNLEKLSCLPTNTIIRKACVRQHWNEEISPLQNIDNIIEAWNDKYFKLYMLSVLVYTNWMSMGNYLEFTDEYNLEETLETINDYNWDKGKLDLIFSNIEVFINSCYNGDDDINELVNADCANFI